MQEAALSQESPFTILGSVEEMTAGSTNSFSDSGPGMQGGSLTGDEFYDAIPER